MKVSYDLKTDFLAIRFESEASTYVDDFGNGVDVVKAEADDRIVGYDLYNARVAILDFKEVTTSQKVCHPCENISEVFRQDPRGLGQT